MSLTKPLTLIVTLLAMLAAATLADERERGSLAVAPILPPEMAWTGASEALIAKPDDPWITPAEAAGFERTPSYAETVAYLKNLVKADPHLKLVSLGRSPLGREIWMLIASKERAFTPDAMRRGGKPTLFFQAGIHSGEIDGKDAGLMLLRDITVKGSKRELLDMANVLFVPIFNVDGHERVSDFGRINQRGPANPGWRVNAQNLNLNRDYMKADTPEMRAMLRALGEWQPDLYVDLHVTDGADYQYDITYGFNPEWGWSPSISKWLASVMSPSLDRDLRAMGHEPGPLVQGIAGDDLTKGIVLWTATPRFSNGYGDAAHIPSILVENHSLKNYRRRVLGTYVALESMIRTVAANRDTLRAAIATDRSDRNPEVPLSYAQNDAHKSMIPFKGIETRFELSPISGTLRTVYTGKPVSLTIPLIPYDKVTNSIKRPRAYWIPSTKPDVIERLAAHGIRMERIDAPREVDVEMYRLRNARFDTSRSWEPNPFEGRARISCDPTVERRNETYPAGSVRVPTDQPLGDVAILLLEPASPDSFVRWGFFMEVLHRIEYFEGYVLEPVAEKMLADDPALASEFREKLETDESFRASADARLDWFYTRTKFADEKYLLYPVGREP